MSYKTFTKTFSSYRLFPRAVSLYALEVAKELDDSRREDFLKMLQEEYKTYELYEETVGKLEKQTNAAAVLLKRLTAEKKAKREKKNEAAQLKKIESRL